MRSIICQAFIVFLLLASFAQAANKPNLLFVIADDCTFRDIGCYGGQAHTPNIDGLAGEGVRMTHCFQTAPMCSPTRHNIYTGQYPVKTGAYPNHTSTYGYVNNITHYLKPLGYRVALSGKTHIGPRNLFPFEYSVANKNPDMQAIDELMAECSKSKTPFCLFACSNEPHSPWNKGDSSRYPPQDVKLPPYLADTPEVRDAFSRYLAEITFYDGQVGQLLELLDKHELAQDTLVMVVSEQGNSFPFAKWTCYDNGLQSAMIVRWPGQIEPGSVSDAMVEYVDVTPTFVELAGGELAAELDGKSMVEVLRGNAQEHKEFVYGVMTTRGIINGNDSYPIRSIRNRNHKLILNLNNGEPFTNACTKSREYQSIVRAAETGDLKAKQVVQRYQNRPAIEFYDVIADPLEMNNLADSSAHQQTIKQLKQQLYRWMESQGDRGAATELVANQHKQANQNQTRKRNQNRKQPKQ
ncbi:MAG: sulfatase-like hydrolase/transferase [Rubripirellula sp.]